MPLNPPETTQHWERDEIVVTDPRTIRRAIGAAAVGNITEWFDFGVYGYFALTMEKLFFSDLSDFMGKVAVGAVFATGFLIRPVGGAFFGVLADRIGRNRVLAITMLLMAGSTFLIGCIPDPRHIGVTATVLLLLFRLLQGFSTGGEYGNAMTFIAEYAPDRKRGFLGSWLEFGTFTGYIMGASAASIADIALTDDQLLSWGWRIPFLLALPLGAIGLYLRAKLEDTPAFQHLEAEQDRREREHRASYGARDMFALWRFMLICMGLVIAWNVTNYMLTAYMPTYVTDTLPKMNGKGIDSTSSQIIQVVVMVLALFTIPLLGMLSDRIGRKPVAWFGSIGLVVLALPMMILIRSDSRGVVFAGLLIMALLLICFSSTMPSTLPSLFPTNVRAGGLSISFNVAISLFCGTTSFLMSLLVGKTHDLNWPAYYLIFAGVCGALATFFLREPNGRPMWGSAPAAVDQAEAQEIYDTQGIPVVTRDQKRN